MGADRKHTWIRLGGSERLPGEWAGISRWKQEIGIQAKAPRWGVQVAGDGGACEELKVSEENQKRKQGLGLVGPKGHTEEFGHFPESL